MTTAKIKMPHNALVVPYEIPTLAPIAKPARQAMPQRGNADDPGRPLPVTARCKTQRVILQGLLGGGHRVEVYRNDLVQRLLALLLCHAAKQRPTYFLSMTGVFPV